MSILNLFGDNSKRKNNCNSKSQAYKSICKTVRIRNAFLHYVNEYRKRIGAKQPMWKMIINAGKRWNDLPLNEKLRHLKAARGTVYTTSVRHPKVNEILRHLRDALQDDKDINCAALAIAVNKIQSWKKSVWEQLNK